ncbi:DMT family transporter [Escherichia coli]|uniref:EamA family transporter n=1 Tax=Escherichia coli TaxID=562 RepID=UPI0039C1E132
MMKLQGIVFVLLGAISYGLPASLVKIAQTEGLTEGNILFFQFLLASVFLGTIYVCLTRTGGFKAISVSTNDKRRLIFSGSALALTNSFYFASLEYISVAIAAVMLMQSVWITTVLDFLFKKVTPPRYQVLCIIIILLGTVLATNVIESVNDISVVGLAYSFMAGFCYAITIMMTNSLAPNASSTGRAFYLSLGALIVISIIWGWQLNIAELYLSLKWGSIIAIFSIVLPLLCFTQGMPKITASMGGVLSALELPASIVFAIILLSEKVNELQIFGVLLILIAIASVNVITTKH